MSAHRHESAKSISELTTRQTISPHLRPAIRSQAVIQCCPLRRSNAKEFPSLVGFRRHIAADISHLARSSRLTPRKSRSRYDLQAEQYVGLQEMNKE